MCEKEGNGGAGERIGTVVLDNKWDGPGSGSDFKGEAVWGL